MTHLLWVKSHLLGVDPGGGGGPTLPRGVASNGQPMQPASGDSRPLAGVVISAPTPHICAVNGGIQQQLNKEVLHYDYRASFFDIFLLAVFRFAALILAYAVCKLRHWWAIAITTAVSCAFLIAKVILSKLLSQGAFGYLLPIISFVLAWIETWLLDFKVLPQEAEDENRYQSIMDATERAPLMGPGPLSDGQFYSPPESVADSDEDLDDKHDPEKGLIQQVT
ncbi:MLN64 N-terminal domain homolog [Lates japonicus]|uniref:MLN64 N-terminal domain homolog n=1 Tax=Lates japonicus TaxID=270547 RepID=A0AAD3MA52_LATJO|nr:MLN64 N-terminal domain homolog [Lates japonicus]